MSAFDLVIRGGTVADGNGGPPRTADVGVTGGVIADVGPGLGRGRREVSADGALVTPGFTDIHTHDDGQASWDERLIPSSWHGVTTVVMGNCGVGFAPATPGHRQRLIDLMEGIEDIPGTALHAGLAWDWESFGDYLSSLAARPHDVDVAAQVPHAALRVHVMGDRAMAGEAATPDDVSAMAGLARSGVGAGALGFTTSRTLNHRSVTGELTPTYDSEIAELAGIAAALGEAGQARIMRDPAFKAALLAAQTGERNRNLIGGRVIHTYDLMYELADPPCYEPNPADLIAARAAREGRDPADLAYDVITGDDGRRCST